MRAALAAAALGVIGVADRIIHRREPRWIVIGLLDHPAHLATAAIGLLALRPRADAFAAATLAGSVLPDVDHVPLALGEHPSPGDPRPRSHALVALAPTAAAALLTRGRAREVSAGLTAGGLAHFARDLAVGGSGVPLLWPASDRDLRVPYAAYAAALAALATLTLRPSDA